MSATLKDFPPTRDLEFARPDWPCGPCGQTRDSAALERANFDALCNLLDDQDPHGRTWEIVRFGHWAVGWVDEVFTEPGTISAQVAEVARQHLAEFTSLDDELWQEYCDEDAADEALDCDSVTAELEDLKFDPINDGGRGMTYAVHFRWGSEAFRIDRTNGRECIYDTLDEAVDWVAHLLRRDPNQSADTSSYSCLSLRVYGPDNEIFYETCGNVIIQPPVAPLSTLTGKKQKMVKLQIKREGGRLFMYVNAKGLHETLDAIGVASDPLSNMYKDRPPTQHSVSSSGFTLSTETLLKKDYPAKFDLTATFTQPPSITNLHKLRDSGYEQCRKILEHYQPIDISLDIQKKLLK